MLKIISLSVMIGLTLLYFSDLGLIRVLLFWLFFFAGFCLTLFDSQVAQMSGSLVELLCAVIMYRTAKRTV